MNATQNLTIRPATLAEFDVEAAAYWEEHAEEVRAKYGTANGYGGVVEHARRLAETHAHLAKNADRGRARVFLVPSPLYLEGPFDRAYEAAADRLGYRPSCVFTPGIPGRYVVLQTREWDVLEGILAEAAKAAKAAKK